MAAIGLNVSRDGRHAPALIRSLGATWARIVATPEHDLTDWLRGCRDHGVRVLLVLARESGTDYGSYAGRYAGLVAAVQVGNEPDLESPSSWTMSPREFADLGHLVRRFFPTTPLVCGGLASGQPGWLDGMDLSWCDSIAVHPYAKDSENPYDLEDQPDAQPLIREYRRYGKPIVVTEWGWPGTDEGRGREEVADMVGWAARTTEIGAYFHFCADDAMVPPFGLLRADSSDKPAAVAFREQAATAVDTGWPAAPAPAGPDPWEHFTAEQIAAASGCPVAAVRENWPRLVEQMAHCGINDRATQVAMIGTVAIETASTFRPVREAYYLGEPEPAESWRRANLRYYPYYGRGYIQLTWRENYAAYGPKIAQLWGAGGWEPDFDLVGNPDRALEPDISAAVSALYFRDHGGTGSKLIPKAANRGDWREVRRLVQGADAGLDRLVAIAGKLQAVQPPPPPPTDPRDEKIAALELALRTLRDDTLPSVRARLDEAERIVTQFIGAA